jgi:hypothetical protein
MNVRRLPALCGIEIELVRTYVLDGGHDALFPRTIKVTDRSREPSIGGESDVRTPNGCETETAGLRFGALA